MNKFSSLLALFFSIFLFSCSEANIPEHSPTQPGEESDGPALYLYIDLSSVESAVESRANSYDNGTADENKIENGLIYVYEKKQDTDEEGDYVCVSSGNLRSGTESDQSEEISKKISYKNIEISNFDFNPESEDYYVLVILNAEDDNHHIDRDKFKFPEVGEKFSTWAKKEQAFNMLYQYDNNVRHNYIVMTNATGHINMSSGETFTPKTLIKLNKEDISKTKFDDSHQTKTTIYVQRNVAKVRVNLRNKENTQANDLPVTSKLFSIGDFTLQVNFSSWHLDRVNTKTYPVMNIEELSWDRSYSHEGTEFNRVHWAIDPNYNEDEYEYSSTTNIGVDFSRSITPYSAGKGEVLYCLENTMKYDKMLQDQTTRVIMYWTLEWWGTDPSDNTKRGEDLKLPNDYLYNSNNQIADKKVDVIGNNFDDYGMFIIGEDARANIWDFKHIEAAMNVAAKEIEPDKQLVFSLKQKSGTPTVDGKPNNLDGGYYTLKELIDVTEEESPVSLSDDEWIKLGNALNMSNVSDEKIAYYPATFTMVNNEVVSRIGVYYVIRIRHFSDSEGQVDGDYISWNKSTEIKSQNNKLIADYKQKHLGRYGVVRNNFYDIYITKINSLGTPEPIPEIKVEDTDDMPETPYLEMEIKVRPWTVRQNEFEF